MTLFKVIASNLILAFCLRYLQPHVLQETNMTKSYHIEFSKVDLSIFQQDPFIFDFHRTGAIRLSSCDTLTPVLNTFRFVLLNHTFHIYDPESMTDIVQQVVKAYTLLAETRHAIAAIHKTPNVLHSIDPNQKPFRMASVPWTEFPVLFIRLVWHHIQPSEFMLLAISLAICSGIHCFYPVYRIQDNQICLSNKPIRPTPHNKNKLTLPAEKKENKIAHNPISTAQRSENDIDSSVRRVWVDMWGKLGDKPSYEFPQSIFGPSFRPLHMSKKRLSKMPKQKFERIKRYLDCLPEPLTPKDYAAAQTKRNEALLKDKGVQTSPIYYKYFYANASS